MKINFKQLTNNDRVNVAKALKYLYNLYFIKLDELTLDFENRILRVNQTSYTLDFDSVICIDFNKYNL